MGLSVQVLYMRTVKGSFKLERAEKVIECPIVWQTKP